MNMLKNRKEYAKKYVAWKLQNAAERKKLRRPKSVEMHFVHGPEESTLLRCQFSIN